MEDLTPNLSLPFIMPSQAQKHVTHNEAIQRLDILTQMVAQSRSLSEPPTNPQNGFLYLIAQNANGSWTGRENQIAAFQEGAFVYLTPQEGWRAYVIGDGFFVFDSTTWVEISGNSDELSDLTNLGINTDADEVNRLAVRSDVVLMTHENGDIRTVVNKETSAHTASCLFQTNFSGRAEIGLTGDDDFHFRVSEDGVNFRDALTFDRASGVANFPNGYARNGVSSDTMTATNSQMAVLLGPDAVRFEPASRRLGWQGSFLTISSGRGSHYSLSGFFHITQPPIGAIVSGFGGAVDDTVSEDGIRLNPWDALYYVLPIGGTAITRSENFRRVRHTSNFTIPNDEVWVFIAILNGDTNEIRLGNGETIYPDSEFMFRDEAQRSNAKLPAFHVHSINQFNGNERLIFSSILTDHGNNFDIATGLFTAPRRGVYQFNCALYTDDNNPTGTGFDMHFRKNGIQLPSTSAATETVSRPNQHLNLKGSALLELEQGDTIECFLQGGLLSLGNDLNQFSGHLISN